MRFLPCVETMGGASKEVQLTGFNAFPLTGASYMALDPESSLGSQNPDFILRAKCGTITNNN